MTTHDPATVGARRVMLVRYRPGLPGLPEQTAAGIVHLIPLPARAEAAGTVRALCGACLGATQIETMRPGEGVPCTLCVVVHLSGHPADGPPSDDPPSGCPPSGCPPSVPAPLPAQSPGQGGGHVADGTGAGRLAAAADYHAWGWPVTVHRDQIWLTLDTRAVALIIPITLAAAATAVLATRRCPAPVLIHPSVPDHRIVLGGEPYGVPLPWPPAVHRATGVLPLPPTMIPRGPLAWIHPPEPPALRLCTEIDIFGALHTLGQVGGGS